MPFSSFINYKETYCIRVLKFITGLFSVMRNTMMIFDRDILWCSLSIKIDLQINYQLEQFFIYLRKLRHGALKYQVQLIKVNVLWAVFITFQDVS